MPLDPDLAAFLELVAAGAGGGLPLHRLPPAEARRRYDASTLSLDPPGPRLAAVQPIGIPCRDGVEIPARLYVPGPDAPQGASGQPVLLYFHGGGYCVGSLDSHDSLCRALAALTPCRVLSVAYRLAPEHRFPQAVHDAQDAYLWLLSQGAAHDLDSRRIAVGGDSAGGTLATGLAIAARDAAWTPPAHQVLLYPCTSVRQDTASHQRLAQGHLLEAATLQWMYGNYLRDEGDRLDWRFAPLAAPTLAGLPPAFIALAEFDPLVDEGVAYAERLKREGVATELRIYAGMTHDFARLGNIVPAAADRLRRDIAAVLARAFAPGAAHAGKESTPSPP